MFKNYVRRLLNANSLVYIFQFDAMSRRFIPRNIARELEHPVTSGVNADIPGPAFDDEPAQNGHR